MLYQRTRYKWHLLALRFLVLGLFAAVYSIFKPGADLIEKIWDFVEHKLPDPRIIDRVPFNEFSKREQKSMREYYRKRNLPLPTEMQ